MSTDPDISHTSAAGLTGHVAAPNDADAAAQCLKHGARGAFDTDVVRSVVSPAARSAAATESPGRATMVRPS